VRFEKETGGQHRITNRTTADASCFGSNKKAILPEWL
jgi:hypothetical protein